MGWFKNAPAPVPLAGIVNVNPNILVDPVTGLLFTAPFPQAGVQPVPQTVLGGTPIDSGFHQGARFTLGGWIDCHQTFGVESSYFFLSQTTRTQTVGTAPGNNVNVIPFNDPTGGTTLTGLPGPSFVNPIQGFAGTPAGIFNTNEIFNGLFFPTNNLATLTTSTRLQGARS